MSDEAVLNTISLGFPWETPDPFLFCVHHLDVYPKGNEKLGPAASLAGRQIGMDFEGKDGWRMYHGDVVPGFPRHPHRGFETVTLARQGFIDHADSLGATARFGNGDVQWITTGRGIVHAEMFPLIHNDAPNPVELFQIWLNLPGADKMVEPHFKMLWNEGIPHRTFRDDAGNSTEVTLVAGALEDAKPPGPPPHSWAARSDARVAIWTIHMAPHARWVLPAAEAGLNRTLYVYEGAGMQIGTQEVSGYEGAVLRAEVAPVLQNGPEASALLMLQGLPIGEPVAQHGPFVMNTRAELEQTFQDYHRTEFGGWPWPSDGPVHPRDEGRLARYPDGTLERGGGDGKG